jgi:hypothetical protein
MVVRAPASAHAATAPGSATATAHTGDAWVVEQQADGERHSAALPTEGRAERWATWVLIYLAALTASLAIGASAWALGLAG